MKTIRPIVKKSVIWSKHGNRRGLLGLSVAINRELRRPRKRAKMYESIASLMSDRKRGPND